MSYRMHAASLGLALTLALAATLPTPAFAQARGRQAAAQPQGERLHSVRRLNTAYRFTPPVRTVDALKRTMSRANTQRDLRTLLDQAGLTGIQADVLRNLTEGTVTNTSIDPGTMLVWMAERRRGRPDPRQAGHEAVRARAGGGVD